MSLWLCIRDLHTHTHTQKKKKTERERERREREEREKRTSKIIFLLFCDWSFVNSFDSFV